MNRFAYLTTGFAIKALSSLSKARIYTHGREHIPTNPTIFVINHFTRIETLFLPYHVYQLARVPVWSLADYTLFKGSLIKFFDNVGVVSTKNPDRDLLIVKSLLSGDAMWIIFPEGRMVKSKQIIEKGKYMISYAGGKHPPHTGAATLALRTEFYRQKIRHMATKNPEEANRLMKLFQADSISSILEKSTYIVPVNITYYPIRAKENILSNLASKLSEDLPDRMMEELMTEGTMLLSGVDIDIRFGKSIEIRPYLDDPAIQKDIFRDDPIHFDDILPSRDSMRKIALKIMQRYMSAIYCMTTVNHDHLFASILKAYPFRSIDVKDLKRRVFLASTKNIFKTGGYFHKSLLQDQTHLLVDDRFGKFEDFVNLATEKKIISRQGNLLVKDHSKLTAPFNFHQARVDNPIGVIANEVEPLDRLKRKLLLMAWQPNFWIKRSVVRFLIERAYREYLKDYKTFYQENVSKAKSVGMPFLVEGDPSERIGVVLVHGYLAAPLEVKELALYLGSKGIWVYVPRLKGHGTSPQDLATRKYMDWVNSMDAGYAIMSNICPKVIVGGFSTGGALALHLATRVKDIAGVFAISPPVKLQDLLARFVPAVDAWNRLMEWIHLKGAQKTFVENNPENPHINYSQNPISGVKELELLVSAIEPKLADIQVPALVAQSRMDPVVDHRGAKRVFELLGSKDKQFILFNFDRHGILLGEGAHRVHRAIGDFIEHLK